MKIVLSTNFLLLFNASIIFSQPITQIIVPNYKKYRTVLSGIE